MKKILLIIVLTITSTLAFSQSPFPSGIKIGPNSTAVTISKVTYSGGILKFYSGSTEMLKLSDRATVTQLNLKADASALALKANASDLNDTITLSTAFPAAAYTIPTYTDNAGAKAALGVGRFWKKSTGEIYITVP